MREEKERERREREREEKERDRGEGKKKKRRSSPAHGGGCWWLRTPPSGADGGSRRRGGCGRGGVAVTTTTSVAGGHGRGGDHRPEEPQIESKEYQHLVLVKPPTFPYIIVKPYKGVEVREHSQIFYIANTFVLDDHDDLRIELDGLLCERPQEEVEVALSIGLSKMVKLKPVGDKFGGLMEVHPETLAGSNLEYTYLKVRGNEHNFLLMEVVVPCRVKKLLCKPGRLRRLGLRTYGGYIDAE
ncbi:hypothetical protein Syun_004391 [Stephania yunnanensis]|uniref:Uncharacterized protein n=1 Tax=Stephania yunnanensis TaxID=152371 RepID=A0AAP0L697_9MAGN